MTYMNGKGSDKKGSSGGRGQRLKKGITLILVIFTALALCNCAAQRKHHKAVPCPCEKHNKR